MWTRPIPSPQASAYQMVEIEQRFIQSQVVLFKWKSSSKQTGLLTILHCSMRINIFLCYVLGVSSVTVYGAEQYVSTSSVRFCFISPNDFPRFQKKSWGGINPTREPDWLQLLVLQELRRRRSYSWNERMFILDGFLSPWLLSVNSQSGKKIIFLSRLLAIMMCVTPGWLLLPGKISRGHYFFNNSEPLVGRYPTRVSGSTTWVRNADFTLQTMTGRLLSDTVNRWQIPVHSRSSHWVYTDISKVRSSSSISNGQDAERLRPVVDCSEWNHLRSIRASVCSPCLQLYENTNALSKLTCPGLTIYYFNLRRKCLVTGPAQDRRLCGWL